MNRQMEIMYSEETLSGHDVFKLNTLTGHFIRYN